MKKMKRRVVVLIIIFSLLSCSGLPEIKKQGLRIVALQLCIDKSLYASEQRFYAYADDLISRARQEYNPDLIVFPEYTGALFMLFDYPGELSAAETLEGFLEKVRAAENDRLLTLHKIFLHNDCAGTMDRIWEALAVKHSLYILGGTYFAADTKTGKLYNRAVVYGPDGKRFYEQDKVFIAPLEKEYFRLDGACMSDAGLFTVNGKKIALTICRDTYYEDWEKYFSAADVWINIKANNGPIRSDKGSCFTWSLVDRVRGSGVGYGISACLTGELFGQRFEGKSVVIHNGIERFAYTGFGQEMLVLDLE
ncbi:MAG: carbon-nitrogen hydrolase family protein [Spirochaetales bacterium]|nr:carbon-nitrogen hydrolase family protein [Spirochaetales bacterium]